MTDSADRLRAARIDAGYTSAADAARALGVNYQTYAGHENGQRGIKRSSAVTYAKRFKVGLEWLLTGKDAVESAVGTIPVVGKVAAGNWMDSEDVEAAESYDMPRVPAVADYPLDWQYAFTVDGPSINLIAAPGDKLICLDVIASGRSFEDGELVVVERTRHNGQMVERTAKRVRRTTSGYDLCPESSDPAFQNAIAIDDSEGHEDGHECVRVKAVVLWIMRKP